MNKVAVDTIEYALEQIQLQLEKAKDDGKLMACIWRVDSEGTLHRNITTFKFPKNDFQRVVDGLQAYIRQERQYVEEVEALPEPDPKTLFGEDLEPANGKSND